MFRSFEKTLDPAVRRRYVAAIVASTSLYAALAAGMVMVARNAPPEEKKEKQQEVVFAPPPPKKETSSAFFCIPTVCDATFRRAKARARSGSSSRRFTMRSPSQLKPTSSLPSGTSRHGNSDARSSSISPISTTTTRRFDSSNHSARWRGGIWRSSPGSAIPS